MEGVSPPPPPAAAAVRGSRVVTSLLVTAVVERSFLIVGVADTNPDKEHYDFVSHHGFVRALMHSCPHFLRKKNSTLDSNKQRKINYIFNPGLFEKNNTFPRVWGIRLNSKQNGQFLHHPWLYYIFSTEFTINTLYIKYTVLVLSKLKKR